jgi:plasmid stability protein
MASITIKNIPESLHVAYRRRAKANARSLQAEILHTLARNVVAPTDAGQLTAKDVAGMLKPRRKGITIEAMHEGIEQSLRKSWK